MAAGRQEMHPHAGRQSKGIRLRHLRQGLPLEQAVHPFPPIGQLDDAERGRRAEFWHMGR